LGQRAFWVDRAGRETPVDSQWHGNFSSVELSPERVHPSLHRPLQALLRERLEQESVAPTGATL